MTTLAPHDVDLAITDLAELLERANRAAARLAETDAAFPTHSLALGILLVQARVANLRPRAADLSGDLEEDEEPDEVGIVELLRAAETITRWLPLEEPALTGLSDVVLELCELVREAEALA